MHNLTIKVKCIEDHLRPLVNGLLVLGIGGQCQRFNAGVLPDHPDQKTCQVQGVDVLAQRLPGAPDLKGFLIPLGKICFVDQTYVMTKKN